MCPAFKNWCKITIATILHSNIHFKILNFQNFKINVAMQNGCYGDFAPILEFRTYNAKTRELFKRIYLHLTICIR